MSTKRQTDDPGREEWIAAFDGLQPEGRRILMAAAGYMTGKRGEEALDYLRRCAVDPACIYAPAAVRILETLPAMRAHLACDPGHPDHRGGVTVGADTPA